MNDPLKNLYNTKFRNDNLTLSAESKARIKEQIFAKLGTQIADDEPAFSVWSNLSAMFLKSYILVPLMVLLFISGTAVASAHALPGDPLYPLKRQVENARLLLAPTAEAKLELQIQYAQTRLEEAAQVSSMPIDDSPIVSDTNINAQDKKDNDEKKNDNNGNNTFINGNSFRGRKTLRQVQAETQANDALNFLNETQKQFTAHGDNDKAKFLQDQINKVRNRNNHSGEVKSDKEEQKGIPIPDSQNIPSSVTPPQAPRSSDSSDGSTLNRDSNNVPEVKVQSSDTKASSVESISSELKF